MAGGIYGIQNTITNKVYVGSAVNFMQRWKGHCAGLNKGVHHGKKLQAAWNKYGESVFVFHILEDVADKMQLLLREQVWLDKAFEEDIAYNTCRRAGNTLGFKRDVVAKQKISAASKNMLRTPEHYAKVSLAQKGKTISTATRAKLSFAQKGKKANATEEERAKCAHADIKQSPASIEQGAAKRRGKKMAPGVGFKRWATRRAAMEARA